MALVALIGRPNVGKSTIFNRLIGERKSIEAKEAGTTRDRVYGSVTHHNRTFTLVDVAGIAEVENNFDALTNEQVTIAKNEADAFLLVVDASVGLLEEDKKVANDLRKLNKPVFIVANKADNPQLDTQSYEFARLGFKGVFPTSAIHNSGFHDLLEAVIQVASDTQKKQAPNHINVALIGRPNVGKSTMLNQFAGETRAIVSPIAGTTRDTIDIRVPYKELELTFVDTAGIRRRGKIETGVEQFSVMRSIHAIEQSDIAVLLIDGVEGASAGDTHIAGVAIEAGKGLLLVVNKWDAYIEKIKAEKSAIHRYDKDAEIEIDEDDLQRRYLAKLQTEFAFVSWAPVVFASALDGLNAKKILDQVWKISHARTARVEKEVLAEVLEMAINTHPHLPKVYAFEQSGTNPPRFDVIINRPETWHFSFSRFLENLLRKANNFNGTPVQIRTIAKASTKK